VKDASEISGGGGFGDLEDSFFDRAPPEVAVAPPPAATFDDLDPVRPARLNRRTGRGRRLGPERRKAPARETPRGVDRFRTLLSAARGALGRAWNRARTWSGPFAARSAERARTWLAASAARGMDSAAAAWRAARARFMAELPSERPDSRTVIAALAALVIVCGLSASVLGGRGGFHLSPVRPAAAGPVSHTAR
jgi:hypothetical protein